MAPNILQEKAPGESAFNENLNVHVISMEIVMALRQDHLEILSKCDRDCWEYIDDIESTINRTDLFIVESKIDSRNKEWYLFKGKEEKESLRIDNKYVASLRENRAELAVLIERFTNKSIEIKEHIRNSYMYHDNDCRGLSTDVSALSLRCEDLRVGRNNARQEWENARHELGQHSRPAPQEAQERPERPQRQDEGRDWWRPKQNDQREQEREQDRDRYDRERGR